MLHVVLAAQSFKRAVGEDLALFVDRVVWSGGDLRLLPASKGAANVVPLLSALVNLKWSKPSDLADAIEQLAIESEAAAANLSGELDRLEEELFTFSKVVAGDNALL